jgi:hypothetical protein
MSTSPDGKDEWNTKVSSTFPLFSVTGMKQEWKRGVLEEEEEEDLLLVANL